MVESETFSRESPVKALSMELFILNGSQNLSGYCKSLLNKGFLKHLAGILLNSDLNVFI